MGPTKSAGNEGENGEEEEDNEGEEEDVSGKNADQGEKTGVPVDSGWAWVVLAAGIIAMFVIGGIRKNFGILFVAFQNRFGSNASTTSLTMTLQSSMNSVSSLFIMTVGMKFMSIRVSIMIGGVLGAASYIITAFAKDIQTVLLSEGILVGCSISLMYPPIMAVIGAYFEKRRGLAYSLIFSGGSVGGFGYAPLFTFLLDMSG